MTYFLLVSSILTAAAFGAAVSAVVSIVASSKDEGTSRRVALSYTLLSQTLLVLPAAFNLFFNATDILVHSALRDLCPDMLACTLLLVAAVAMSLTTRRLSREMAVKRICMITAAFAALLLLQYAAFFLVSLR